MPIMTDTDHNHNSRSGDPRVNENPGLTLYHTIWHREHNRSVKGPNRAETE